MVALHSGGLVVGVEQVGDQVVGGVLAGAVGEGRLCAGGGEQGRLRDGGGALAGAGWQVHLGVVEVVGAGV